MTVRRVGRPSTPKQRAAQLKWQAAGVAARHAKAAIVPGKPPAHVAKAVVAQDKRISKARQDTVTLYHSTTVANAQHILKEGFNWGPQESGWGGKGSLGYDYGKGAKIKRPIWFHAHRTWDTADYLDMKPGNRVILKVAGIPSRFVQSDFNAVEPNNSERQDKNGKVYSWGMGWQVAPLEALKGTQITKALGALKFNPKPAQANEGFGAELNKRDNYWQNRYPNTWFDKHLKERSADLHRVAYKWAKQGSTEAMAWMKPEQKKRIMASRKRKARQ